MDPPAGLVVHPSTVNWRTGKRGGAPSVSRKNTPLHLKQRGSGTAVQRFSRPVTCVEAKKARQQLFPFFFSSKRAESNSNRSWSATNSSVLSPLTADWASARPFPPPASIRIPSHECTSDKHRRKLTNKNMLKMKMMVSKTPSINLHMAVVAVSLR